MRPAARQRRRSDTRIAYGGDVSFQSLRHLRSHGTSINTLCPWVEGIIDEHGSHDDSGDRGRHHCGRRAVEIYAGKVEIERGPPQWRLDPAGADMQRANFYSARTCLHYPRKRTCAAQTLMSALGQKRTSNHSITSSARVSSSDGGTLRLSHLPA